MKSVGSLYLSHYVKSHARRVYSNSHLLQVIHVLFIVLWLLQKDRKYDKNWQTVWDSNPSRKIESLLTTPAVTRSINWRLVWDFNPWSLSWQDSALGQTMLTNLKNDCWYILINCFYSRSILYSISLLALHSRFSILNPTITISTHYMMNIFKCLPVRVRDCNIHQ